MIRRIVNLCCLSLLGGVVASISSNETDTSGIVCNFLAAQPASSSTSGACLDRLHPLPLIADAEVTDDEELSDSDWNVPVADYVSAADTSRRAACSGPTVQPPSANTLNALGVRLQI